MAKEDDIMRSSSCLRCPGTMPTKFIDSLQCICQATTYINGRVRVSKTYCVHDCGRSHRTHPVAYQSTTPVMFCQVADAGCKMWIGVAHVNFPADALTLQVGIKRTCIPSTVTDVSTRLLICHTGTAKQAEGSSQCPGSQASKLPPHNAAAAPCYVSRCKKDVGTRCTAELLEWPWCAL
eukprot:352476-Chlamydomonas_euryale.AAC.26